MAGKYGASDLGSDWITVPRKFRGRKPTSSDTELAYITGAEKGLLSKFARANQVGPSNIPSYDDSGFTMETDESKKTKKNPFGYTGGYKTVAPTTKTNPSKLSQMQAFRGGTQARADYRKQIGATPARTASQVNDLAAAVAKAESRQGQQGTYQRLTKGGPGTGGGDTDIMSGPEFHKDDDDRWKNVPEGSGDETKTTSLTCAQKGMVDDGAGGCKKKDGTEEEDDKCKGVTVPSCPEDKPNGNPKCVNGEIDFSDCSANPDNKTCEYGKDDNGNCKTKPVDEDDDGGTGTFILDPQNTPTLRELTSDMDLRNMLGNVLNKNNPLFKQARTRALQAMSARGVVNSSMAEEAVMSAIMSVAMPIATRVIDDLQRVMELNANASDAFKLELNKAYYQEVIARVNNAAQYQMQFMMQSNENWRRVMETMAASKDIKTDEQFDRYMTMITGGGYDATKGYTPKQTQQLGVYGL